MMLGVLAMRQILENEDEEAERQREVERECIDSDCKDVCAHKRAKGD
jgi:hypothetical protein